MAETDTVVARREWLIRKGAYFYRPNKQGYTAAKFEAGRYTKEDAEREAEVEPWHMTAVHQDEWPDDPVPASANLIARLQAENEALRRELGEERDESMWRFWRDKAAALATKCDAEKAAREAAEAKAARLEEEKLAAELELGAERSAVAKARAEASNHAARAEANREARDEMANALMRIAWHEQSSEQMVAISRAALEAKP